MDDLDRPGLFKSQVLREHKRCEEILHELRCLGVKILLMPVVVDEQGDLRVQARQFIWQKRVRLTRNLESRLWELSQELSRLVHHAMAEVLESCGHGCFDVAATVRIEPEVGDVWLEEFFARQHLLGLRNGCDLVVLRQCD
jgi:hypothetical protein